MSEPGNLIEHDIQKLPLPGTEKPEIIPEKKIDFEEIKKVHDKLIDRYGQYKTSSWEPSRENVHILSDEEFDEEVSKYIGEADVTEVVGYALFEKGKLFARASQKSGQEMEETVAHEMLHLWFMKSLLDEGDVRSYGVNETFVDTLALEGMGMYEIPQNMREQTIDGAINNSIIIKEVIEKLGENGWRYLFEACQSGNQENISALMSTIFGDAPLGEFSEINQALPIVFGDDFWNRLKEFALMAYLVRIDPSFQSKNPAVTYQMDLIANWSGISDSYRDDLT